MGPDRTRAPEADAAEPRSGTPVVDRQPAGDTLTANAATARALQGAGPPSPMIGDLAVVGGNQGVARLARQPAAQPAEAPAPDSAPQPAPASASASADSATRVAFVSDDGLNLRAAAEPGAPAVAQLPFGQRVHVFDDAGRPSWSRIAMPGQSGFVASAGIHFPPDQLMQGDPGLSLIRVKPGQTFWSLVKQTYGIDGRQGTPDQNVNHFINAIRAVNQPAAFKVKTGVLDDVGNALVPGRDASDTELTAGVELWVPSFPVAAAMNVGSGTVSGEVTRIVNQIKQTVEDFAGACAAALKHVPAAVAAHAGEMAAGLLDGLIQFAKEAAMVLAASTAAGALVGSLFGGAGAVPGAEVGFELGLLILDYYGLYMLVEAVLAVGGQLTSRLGQFVGLAWRAHGDPKQVEEAGKVLADALGILTAATLTVLAAYLMKEGAEAFAKTRFAARLGEEPIAKWLAERGKGLAARSKGVAAERAPKDRIPDRVAGPPAAGEAPGPAGPPVPREAPAPAPVQARPPLAAGGAIQQVIDGVEPGQTGAGRPVATVGKDNSVRVRVEGVIGDPAAERLGYEKYSNPGSHYELIDYQRAHMYGPGFGDELADGIMLVHKNVNLKLQNRGVEEAIRKLHRLAKAEGGEVLVGVSVTSHPRTPGGPLLLKEANYRVSLRRPDGRVEAAFEVDIGEIGLPGRPSALDPPVSVTLRGADADELAEVLK